MKKRYSAEQLVVKLREADVGQIKRPSLAIGSLGQFIFTVVPLVERR